MKGDTRSLDESSYRDYVGTILPFSLLRTSKEGVTRGTLWSKRYPLVQEVF